MKKFKLFIENFVIFGFGGVICKIVPLIMVPIVTRLMPNTDYFGLSDMSSTVVSFGSALAVMGMYDAMYRLFFEKEDEEYKKDVCSTAFLFTLITSLIIFIIMIFCKDVIAKYFFSNPNYAYIVYISAIATLVGATNSILSAPTRMQNKRLIFLITNTVSPILSYAISVPMLIAGYYTIALPLAGVVSSATMEITFMIINHKWFAVSRFDSKLLKQLLKIAIPLLPNFLVYWVFNSSDKFMITNLIGLGPAGIYSVGAKLGHTSQLIYTAFAGGWQFFAFSTMKEENQVKTNSLIFEYLGAVSFIASTFICAWSHGIYSLLFTDEYIEGYIVAPYLFLSPLLLMLFQVEANQFIVVKKTWPNMFILSAGAALNVFINWTLIPVLGIEGAAIATLVGYIVSDVICTIVLIKMKLMVLSKRFVLTSLLMIVFMVIWRLFLRERLLLGTMLALIVSCIIVLLYKDPVIKVISMIKNRKQKK